MNKNKCENYVPGLRWTECKSSGEKHCPGYNKILCMHHFGNPHNKKICDNCYHNGTGILTEPFYSFTKEQIEKILEILDNNVYFGTEDDYNHELRDGIDLIKTIITSQQMYKF